MKNSILGKARWLRDVALATSKNSGARVAREWLKYAAMFVMLLTLGIGNAWGAVNNGDLFERISAAPAANDEVMIVNSGETVAMSTTQNSNNRGQTSISTSSNQYIYASTDNVQVLTVKVDGTYYGFHTSGGSTGGFLNQPSNSNYLRTTTAAYSTALADATKWSLSVSSSVFTIQSKRNTAYYLQHNSGSSIFSTYKNTQNNPSIYKKVMSAPTAVAASSITSSGATITITDATNVNNYELYYSKSSTAPNASSTASTTITSGKSKAITGLDASSTYYLWARAYSTSPSRKTGWVALTGTTFTTSSAGTSVSLSKAATTNGSFTLSPASSVTTTSSAQTVTVSCSPNTGYYVSAISATNPATCPSAITYGGSNNSRTVIYPTGANGESTISVTFSPIWYLKGDFNSWDTSDPLTNITSNVATVTKSLSKTTGYEFKVYNAQEDAWYGNNGKIIDDVSGWTFSTSEGNCKVFATVADDYTFKFNISTKAMQVQYPSMTHPNDAYVYLTKWWDCYVHYWYTDGEGDHPLIDWGYDTQLSRYEEICETNYWCVPILDGYPSLIMKDAAGDPANTTGNQTTASNAEKYITHDGSNWVWRDFATYTITYVGGGGTGSMSPHAGKCPGSEQQLTANAFTKSGYNFSGWTANVAVKISGSTVPAGTLIANEATIQDIQSDITLTAQWVKIPTITRNPSVLAFGDKKVDGSYDLTFTVSAADLYSTNGLTLAVMGSNKGMYSIDKSSIAQTSTGTITSTTVTVTYHPTAAGSHADTDVRITTPNGVGGTVTVSVTLSGTGIYAHSYIDNIWGTVIADQTAAYTRPTIADKDPGALTDCQHLHYHFVGWITKTKYDAGSTIDARTTPIGDIQTTGSVAAPSSNETFYAVWEKAAAGSGSSTDYELVTSSSTALADGDEIIIATSGTAGDANAVAMGYSRGNNRGVVGVTISSGPKISNPTFATETDDDDHIFPLELEADGNYFRIKDKVNDDYLAALGGTSSNYLKLYGASANTGARQFTISVDASGVASISANISGNNKRDKMKYNSGNNPPIISCYNGGYNSLYIYRKPGVTYEDPIATCGAEYTITIDKNNASATCTSCGAKVTANATALSNLVAPTWAGHQVDYYMVASADNSTKIAEADGTLASSVTVSGTPWTDANGKWVKGGDATFYAKWKATECVITLNNEGATTAGTVSVTATYGANTNLTTSIITPTKNGYDFGGYFTEAGGAGTQLINADGSWIASVTGYTNASKQWQLDATALELHAEWTLKSYTVTWVVNGVTEATQANVNYGTTYDALTQEPSVDDDALSSCGSDKFVGWVTQEYTGEGGTAATRYDPYKVSASTLIDDNHHTFYAMFAKEEGTIFDNTAGGEFKIYANVSGTKYYATGNVSGNKIEDTDDINSASTYIFTKISDGVYSIGLKGATGTNTYIIKGSGNTDFGNAETNTTDAAKWTISSSTAGKGSWKIASKSVTTRGFVYGVSQTKFGTYQISDAEGNNVTYYCVEIANTSLTNYRTGCCDEKITLAVSDATSGAGGTVTLQWNNADKSAGDQVSTCSAGTLVAKVTANPSYILTAMAISGTNKSITITPSDLTTGLPSTEEMTYSVAVQALATGTLTITPTFSRTYTVTYDLVGGETSGSTVTVRYQSGEQVTLVTPDPTKSGYNFSDWTVTKESGGNVTVSSGKFTMPTDNVTATATWTEKTLTSISLGSASVEVYVGQYVEIPVTYDPADILTKNYTLVANPSYCVTTNSTITTLKITGGRGGVTITENKTETVSIKANADNSKTASVSVTVKPLPVDHYVDLIHGVSFDDKGSTIVNNELSATYTAPGYGDYSGSTTGDCETNHLHLVGWIDSEWADAHPKATHAEIIAAEGYHTAREAGMTASNKTYYAVWGDEQ